MNAYETITAQIIAEKETKPTMSEEIYKGTPSQRVCWDPDLFVGFSPAEIALIRRGFMHGLDLVYREEQEMIR